MKNNKSRCKYCLGAVTKNAIGEKGCYCELTDKWQNITLGDCIGNCESEELEVEG